MKRNNTQEGLNKMSIQGFVKSTQETSELIYNEREVEENHRIILEATKAELAEAKEELNRAKESAMQSWLDSKPLIDELEKQKANLANAQQSSNSSETAIAELESQLETIHKSIKSKREDQLKTERVIHEINHALDQTRNERLKLDSKKEKQTRAKLRQTLHLRRHTLQTLQLTLQAALLELDAIEVSTAKILQQTDHSKNHTAAVQLTHEDYYTLTRRAEEKISHANLRVSVSMEQKLAAEDTRELASSRLNKFYSSRSWSMNRRNIIGQWYTERDAKSQDAFVEEEVTTNTKCAAPKSHAKSLAKVEGGKPQQSRSSGSNIKTIKKKSFILYKMKKCLEQKIGKMGG